MKRIIITLLSLLFLTMLPTSAEARNKKGTSEISDISRNDASSRKFILQGHVDPNIQDSCYNIYITDLNGIISSENFVARVPVKNKKFRFETDLDQIKSGRIRALFPGDELCSAWIDTYFVPGFTLDMTVHNGYYDINNLSEYNAAVNEWTFYYPQQPPAIRSENKGNAIENERSANLKVALDAYQALLDELQFELNSLRVYNLTHSMRMKESKNLLKKMSKITESMEKLIEKYVQSIK